MAIRRHKPEQIVNLLREIEVGRLKLDQSKRLKELARQNSKLKRLVAKPSLEKQPLRRIDEEALTEAIIALASEAQ
jgi:hypothetical protein